MDGDIRFDDKALDELNIRANTFTRNDSIVVSWSFDEDGKGALMIGHQDPLGIFQRMVPIDIKLDDKALEYLKLLGVEQFKD